jgi:predicted transport protein
VSNLDKAVSTQMANIEKRTGKSMSELMAIVRGSALSKHGELVKMLKTDLGMGHGDANLVVHFALKPDEQNMVSEQSTQQILDGLYSGPKEKLRPIHDKLMVAIHKFGGFEEAPKKTYISYRRKKQFAMIGPATNTRVEVGLNVKGLEATERLLEQPPGRMCNYIVKLTDAKEVDPELIGWIRAAYESAA